MSLKTAIITGGNTEIGRAVALRLADEGYAIVLTGRNQRQVDEAADLIDQVPVLAAAVDEADRTQADRLIAAAVTKFGRVDVLVNTDGARDVALAALPELRKANGNVVNVSAASVASNDGGMYGRIETSDVVPFLMPEKAAGIRVNAVAPAAGNSFDCIIAPEDVASAVAFLASNTQAGMIDGVTLPISGPFVPLATAA